MIKGILIILSAVLFLGCSQDNDDKESKKIIQVEKVKVDAKKSEALVCIEEEGKITCKLMTKRINKDREVAFEWKSPNGKDDRERKIVLPANHASIFDMRHKDGRVKGRWEVSAALDGDEVSTTFSVQ